MAEVATVALHVNGRPREVRRREDRSLLAALREDLGLTGAKPGCGEGRCGACTVLLDGEPALACQTPLEAALGRPVTTIEGLAGPEGLHPVQRAFAEAGALQCGYCTPGMVLAAAALLARTPEPDEGELLEALDGHLCRCCAYPRIRRAVQLAARLATEAAAGPGRPAPTPDAADAPAGAAAGAGAWPAPSPAGAARGALDGAGAPRGTRETGAAPAGAAADGAAPRAAGPRVPWDLTPPEERAYFALLGDGLVVECPPPEGGRRPGGAWLHVGADGRATAFTGKVGVGQDNATALALLVAEELGLAPAAVRLVLGDTDLCPWDPGTFGSRSMVDAGGALRAAAAAARARLVAIAAARWGVPPASLRAAEGRVCGAGGQPAATYGELLRGRAERETVAAPAEPAPATSWRVAGRPAPARDAAAATTGQRRFPSDVVRPGMLYGKVLRPPALGAVLRAVDLSGAQALPGVVAVHEGSFVAVAAADTASAAQALQAVRAEWEYRPQPAEHDLEGYLRSHPAEGAGWERAVDHETGQVEAALAEAALRLEATYTTAYVAHVPLETRAAVAEWDGGRLCVWTGTQRPFGVRAELAAALGVPESLVRVIVPPTGSGFGGKHDGRVAVEAARLARAAGRPVRVHWTRAEEFACAYFRPAAVIDVRSAVDGAGNLLAWDFTNINAGTAGIRCPYEVPHQRLRFRPAASPLPQGSYRALAATANNFAREAQVDELAHRLGADPLAFRLRHLRDARLAAVLRAAAERAGWSGPARGPGRGMGIACGLEKDGRVATCAEVRVDGAGRLEVLQLVTAYECGAIVHPEGLANQVEGATIMALGGALFEAVHFEDGRIRNGSLTAYRVPRLRDVPPVEVVLIDRPDLPPAGGGETPMIAVAPALAGAIFAATGRRLRRLPLAPEGVVG